MNSVLQLKGVLSGKDNGNRHGSPNIPKNNSANVSAKHLEKLIEELLSLDNFWQKENIIDGALIDVHYKCTVAKSNRISEYFKKTQDPNSLIVGARFADINSYSPKHIITYYVTDEIIKDSIKKAESSKRILDAEFNGSIGYTEIEKINDKNIKFSNYKISRTAFLNIIVDSYYVDGFSKPNNSANTDSQQLITIYKTNRTTTDILKNIGINTFKSLSETTLLLYPNDIKILQDKAPYLIAMSVENISKLNLDDITNNNKNTKTPDIPDPTNEPIIGVIDTLFDTRVYFSKWVNYVPMVNPSIIDPADPKDPADYNHGTAVSSIIVDGNNINPGLDDGCGRFRVKHFGVTGNKPFSSFTLIKNIQCIVDKNPNIKVWNLSLGSTKEINNNFISPEAFILDQIQCKNDVIFVIAGTNKPFNKKGQMFIGSPADSINSIVVNSVNRSGDKASYSRRGKVLSFFNKPDVGTFGGDGNKNEDKIRAWDSNGETFVAGTSFAAPWITRKLAYLIEVIGLSRETAKALIIDSANGWNDTSNNSDLVPFIGHGIVPTKIDEIIKSKDDEIKFIINGTSEKYDTYNYNLPVPINKDMYPFVTKATLCYFPRCSANQGVDYTDTELDISIGRISPSGIKTINKNVQTDKGFRTKELDARKFFRKWDNTKHIREKYGNKLQARIVYKGGMCGISIKRKERLSNEKYPLKFGLVVTLKEINGVNRIYDFMQRARLSGWIVNEINVKNQVNIYNQLQQPIDFDS